MIKNKKMKEYQKKYVRQKNEMFIIISDWVIKFLK